MRNRILLTSTALVVAMGAAALAQSERRDPMQASPPAASGAPGEQSAPAQKGRAAQPEVRQVPMPRQQQPSPQAQDQRPQQPRVDRPARAQGGRDLDRDRTTGQAPRGEAQRPAQPRSQDREMRDDQPPRAQERTAPQQPRAQGERTDETSRAQSPAARSGTGVQITQQQRTQIGQRLASRDVHRIERSSVNFNVAIGATVPSSVRFVPLPSTIVSVVPQYRGYYYAVVEDEIVIIEPRTRRIVYVMPYGGSRASVRSERRVRLSQPHREFVRQSVRTRPRVVETTGVVTHEIEIGDVLPETVVIEEFPDTVYRRVPELRSYRYIVRDDDIYLVDRERRVIEVID